LSYNLTIQTDRRVQRAVRKMSISGQLTKDGTPVPGIEVYLMVNGVYVEEVPLTDADGRYEFKRRLPWGHVKLQTEAWITPYGEEMTVVQSPVIYVWVLPSLLMPALLGGE
jgi:hypothetical protein